MTTIGHGGGGGTSDRHEYGQHHHPQKNKRRRVLPKIMPHGLAHMKENYFVQALSQTTMSFCQETTLHGMKYVVLDIEELGATYSR